MGSIDHELQNLGRRMLFSEQDAMMSSLHHSIIFPSRKNLDARLDKTWDACLRPPNARALVRRKSSSCFIELRTSVVVCFQYHERIVSTRQSVHGSWQWLSSTFWDESNSTLYRVFLQQPRSFFRRKIPSLFYSVVILCHPTFGGRFWRSTSLKMLWVSLIVAHSGSGFIFFQVCVRPSLLLLMALRL